MQLIFSFIFLLNYMFISVADDFIEMKSFDLNIENGGIKHSLALNKGSLYKLDLQNTSNPITIELFNQNKKLLGTNHDIRTNKVYPAMMFKCQTTGSYTVNFDSESKVSAVCSISFKVIE